MRILQGNLPKHIQIFADINLIGSSPLRLPYPKYQKAGNKMTTCVFSKDQHVIYASNGICTVEDIKKMAFIKGEPEKTYYILRPKNDRNSTIYIPEDNETLIARMRAPISAGEIDVLISDKSAHEWIDDRKQRGAYFRELLSVPHPSALLPVLKAIIKKHAELTELGKKLSAIDRETFESAMKFVKDEFAFALCDEEKANEYIEKALGKIPNIA